MLRSRYREARTLVRRLCRLPGEDPAEFRRKKARLRAHFERFNVDVSDLCQWLMSVRPRDAGDDRGVPAFWDFFLEPSLDSVDAEEAERDRWRLALFDDVAGLRRTDTLAGQAVPEPLREAMREVGFRAKTPTAQRLFRRMTGLEPAHRLVLLKAAAEWIVARYQRGVENWERQRDEWEKEKKEWEDRHAALTNEVQDRFTDLFKVLVDPEQEGSRGIRRKNPRICLHQRLNENKDNCIYAGEKGHGPLCWKYGEFVRTQKARGRFNDKHFAENAGKYLAIRRGLERPEIKRKLKTSARQEAFNRLYSQKGMERAKAWFTTAWSEYLKALDLNEETVIGYGRLPHCFKIGETWEKSKCEWNPHTELCRQYKDKLAALDPETLKLESDYRDWRRKYLAGPRKPSFRYPSSRHLPMPKIFGERYYEIDFERSVLRLRLDDMPEGEWIEFGFIPWPRDYRPGKWEVKVSSVHVNFLGANARVGFRFDVPHRESRFNCSQDQIDELRSRKFPRHAQDQQFLQAARKRLLEAYCGEAEGDLRILAVDLGETGAGAAVYRGRSPQIDLPLRIIKIDQRYSELPEVLERDKELNPPPKFDRKTDRRGLRKEHVGRHLDQLAEGAQDIAGHREQAPALAVTMRDHDQRGLTRHVGWMIRDWVRHNAAQIVAVAEEHKCDLIVFESLRGNRAPGYEKLDMESERKKRWLALFAYGRIRRKVVEKAVERGMRVVTVPYFKSSQFCSVCGHEQQDKGRWRKNKREHRLECECGDSNKKTMPGQVPARARRCSCKAKLDSDANAARVLARVFWGEIQLPLCED